MKNQRRGSTIAKSIADNVKTMEGWGEAGKNLSKLNTMRGGEGGFKGFVAEHLQAAEATAKGRATTVIDDNSVADLIYTGKNGHKYRQQIKVGYGPGKIKYSKYKGQTILMDKGNKDLDKIIKEGKAQGVTVKEGYISEDDAKSLANAMQIESKLTGKKNAPIISKMVTSHKAGIQTGKTSALYGAGFSLATNTVDVLSGEKDVKKAAVDIAKDTAISYGTGYALGAAGSAIASTTTGATAIGAVTGFATGVGATIAETAVGGVAIGAVTATTGIVTAAGTAATGAVVGAVSTVGSAVGGAAVAATAGTAVGGAVAAGVGAATAGAAAIGAAAVAAAPVVAVGAAVGLVFKGLKELFD